ncbi:Hypothetical_protein [Hexamita inflata]|uniref:Hypothetical_protein n=1 Tax=Hexamita inflata TaxID=28002 RepID=A0AA86UJ09_9EUKA|nr:Hypothetical protein HINF_LOCUS29523 [Hexamita inflata]
MNTITEQFINAIKIQLQLSNDDLSYVIYEVMVLPDVQYNLLFCQLSYDLNVKLESIYQLFIEISQQHLYMTHNLSNEQQLSYTQERQFIETICQIQQHKQIEQRENDSIIIIKNQKQAKDKMSLSQFKQQFSETVKTIMTEFDDSANEMTDKQICQVLKNYFQVHDQNIFWEQVQKEISYKSKLQLKQYFQKSFLQCQYGEISDDDKLRIKELTRAMPQNKPSEIVDIFFNQIGGEVYFRRKVVMFVQYLKRAESK